MAKSTSKSWNVNSTLAGLFNKSPTERRTSCQTWILHSPVITRINLETYNCLNQKVINAISTLDGSMLGVNLIKSTKQITCPKWWSCSCWSISAEAVENSQEHLVANKLGVTRHYFSYSLCLRNHSYVWIEYFIKTLCLKSLWRRTSIWLHVFDLVFWQCDVQMKSKQKWNVNIPVCE